MPQMNEDFTVTEITLPSETGQNLKKSTESTPEILFNDASESTKTFPAPNIIQSCVTMFGDVVTPELLADVVQDEHQPDVPLIPTDLNITPQGPSLDYHGTSGCAEPSQTLMMSTPDEANASQVIYSANVVTQATEPFVGGPKQCMWKGCSQVFHSLECLVNHIHDIHVKLDSSEMYRCQWSGCSRNGKGFNARYKILIHVRTHTNEKPHGCYLCGKHFSRLENLKIHKRTHTGERPYVCPHDGCSKAYSNSSDRFKHVLTHRVERPYECKMPSCTKRYTDPSSLRKHTRTHGHQYAGEAEATNDDGSGQNTQLSFMLPGNNDSVSDSTAQNPISDNLICISKIPQIPYMTNGVPTLINNSFYLSGLISSPIGSVVTFPMTTNIPVISLESNTK